eukprot:SAG31_NODE_6379_length_2039_cov_3.442784_2_plen_166_part_00
MTGPMHLLWAAFPAIGMHTAFFSSAALSLNNAPAGRQTVRAGPDVNARFSCPQSSCWCRELFADGSIKHNSGIYYRTAFNRITGLEQRLLLDEWLAPTGTPRPGALIIHGGGYSTGPFNGCSHSRNMSRFSDRAIEMARHGFAVISIDYRCEGPLRGQGDEFHDW